MSTSSSATTAATPATTSFAGISPNWSFVRAPATRRAACCTTPYTGQAIAFTRGPTTSEAVQIDHLVSLSDAWYKGARGWDDQRRRDFANDPRNLLAVAGQANFDKAFRDATAWLPPNAAFRCEFVARQIDVKAAYALWLSKNEKRAMEDVLARC